MRPYRVLIAVFSLVFLMSGISLLILIIDDQKDLSSRASLVSLSGKKPLEGYQETETTKTSPSPRVARGRN